MGGGFRKKILGCIAGALIAGSSLAYTGYVSYIKPETIAPKITFRDVSAHQKTKSLAGLFLLLWPGIPLGALGAAYLFSKYVAKSKPQSILEPAANNPTVSSIFCLANTALLFTIFDKPFEATKTTDAMEALRQYYFPVAFLSGLIPMQLCNFVRGCKPPLLANSIQHLFYTQQSMVCSSLESRISCLDKAASCLKNPYNVYGGKAGAYLKWGKKEDALFWYSKALKGLDTELKERDIYDLFFVHPITSVILKLFPKTHGRVFSYLRNFDFAKGLKLLDELTAQSNDVSMRFGSAVTLHTISEILKKGGTTFYSEHILKKYLSKELGNVSLERLLELKTDKEWSLAIKNLVQLPNVHDYFESIDGYRVFRIVLDKSTKDIVILKEGKKYEPLLEEKNLLGIIDKALRKIGHKAIYAPGIQLIGENYYLTEFAAAGKRLTEAYLDSGDVRLLKEAAKCTALIHALVPHKGDTKNIYADVESSLAVIDIPPELKQSICDSLPAVIAGFDSFGLVFDSDAHTGQFHCEDEGALVRYDTPYRGATAPESDLNKLLRRGFLFSRDSDGDRAIDDIICSDYLPTFNNAVGSSRRINDEAFLIEFRKRTPLRALAYWLFAKTRRQKAMPAALDTIKNASFDIETLCSRGDISLGEVKHYSELNSALDQLKDYSFVA